MTQQPAPSPKRPATDWEDVETSAIRSLLAEGVVAEIVERDAPGEARWKGGHTAGYDVVAGDKRYNAKSVVVQDGYVTLARRNAQPFDSEKVDYIVLVHLGEAATGFDIDLVSGAARVEGSAKLLDVWSMTVEQINELMPPHLETDPTWRNVSFPLDDLAPFRLSFE